MSVSSNGASGRQGEGSSAHAQSQHQGLRAASGVHSLVKLWLLSMLHIGITFARPFVSILEEEEPKSPDDPSLYLYLGVALFLVLLGGVFAGLTIALMGQDEIYLQVIASSGEGAEKKNATKVLNLLKKGKHWVLVTLLVGNVITNETLPLVLDRSIGGGYIAAITSTALVIIFGEIVPQSACVRFGLPIGAWCANFVFVLMWLLSPISWPIAKLLDYLLGEDHGTTYKKAGLKTLVTLHQTIGPSPADRLNNDEVLIIQGVLDLKAKSVGSIMTPMKDVFTLSTDAILDEEMIDDIEHEGYSRIPIHNPENKLDFLGMLLVKMLITYDPEDARRVSDFSLATLPETRPETSCLDIINFFQQGKSHMVLVSDFPGETHGALGVVTLEDVIEELIGEEIIDESDVFVDVHKAIRRMHPAPTHRARAAKGEVVTDMTNVQSDAGEDLMKVDEDKANGHGDEIPKRNAAKRLSNASADGLKANRPATFLVRRRTSLGTSEGPEVQRREYDSELRQQLKHLGPSNAASAPRGTRVNTIKIKPGPLSSAGQELSPASRTATRDADGNLGATSEHPRTPSRENKGQDLVTPGKAAKDGVQALKVGQQGYGTLSPSSRSGGMVTSPPPDTDDQGVQVPTPPNEDRGRGDIPTIERNDSHSTLGDYGGPASRSMSNKRGQARSGSITEQFVESGGVRKLVLELTSSSEEGGEEHAETSRTPSRGGSKPTSMKGVRWGNDTEDSEDKAGADDAKGGTSKKKRRSRKKKPKGDGGTDGGSENTPLLQR